ncbi:MAG: methyltransferase domain-containing protein [Candidatus Brocadiae bacterium]|nr:methyltransferase domain-containing protein [Candidatus Brocadiia bacterium]
MPSAPDSEFGVPFPGRIAPREQWTSTGLRHPGGTFDWDATFGRSAPRIVDLGCGNGRYLIGSALARPGHDHLGIDLVQVAIDHAARRANRRALPNIRFVTGDAADWIHTRLAPASLDELHIYHPQPYYEDDEASRRLLTPEFLERAWIVVRPRALLVLQSDNRAYWRYLRDAAGKYFEIRTVPGPWPDAPRGRTRREIQARQRGLVVWRMEATRRDVPQDREIRPPDFDANRPGFRRKQGRR